MSLIIWVHKKHVTPGEAYLKSPKIGKSFVVISKPILKIICTVHETALVATENRCSDCVMTALNGF